jgi:hypothetical protein
MRTRKYTDDELKEAVRTSHSMRAVLRRIGLTPAGGNYEVLKKRIQELNLDTSHFLGQAILRGKTHAYGTRPLKDVLVHSWASQFLWNSTTRMGIGPTTGCPTLNSCARIVRL